MQLYTEIQTKQWLARHDVQRLGRREIGDAKRLLYVPEQRFLDVLWSRKKYLNVLLIEAPVLSVQPTWANLRGAKLLNSYAIVPGSQPVCTWVDDRCKDYWLGSFGNMFKVSHKHFPVQYHLPGACNGSLL